jgi:hypothetical protein
MASTTSLPTGTVTFLFTDIESAAEALLANREEEMERLEPALLASGSEGPS